MARVFIINDMNHSFEKAEKFGQLIPVTQGKVPIFKTDIAMGLLRSGLHDFDINEDYVLISGPALLCMMATTIIIQKGASILRTVVFDAKDQDYIVRHIQL